MQQLDLFGGTPVQPEEPRKKTQPKPAPQQMEKVELKEDVKLEPLPEPLPEPLLETVVAEEDKHADKMYYPISEVATMFNVNISLLRYWEKEFDILQPRKNRKGDRLFRPEDIKNLKLIHFLLREKKYTIEGAKSFIKKGKNVNEKFEAIETLKKIRSMLVELRSGL